MLILKRGQISKYNRHSGPFVLQYMNSVETLLNISVPYIRTSNLRV